MGKYHLHKHRTKSLEKYLFLDFPEIFRHSSFHWLKECPPRVMGFRQGCSLFTINQIIIRQTSI